MRMRFEKQKLTHSALWRQILTTLKSARRKRIRNIIDGAAGDAWQLVLKLVELVPDDREVRSFLAAGPAEDFLSSHGDRYIAEVERPAADLPCLKDLLGGVWQNTMSDGLWGESTINKRMFIVTFASNEIAQRMHLTAGIHPVLLSSSPLDKVNLTKSKGLSHGIQLGTR